MKNQYLIYFLIYLAFAKIGTAQTLPHSFAEVVGTYALDQNPEKLRQNSATWELQLKADGTYSYHFRRQLKDQEIEDFYSKGSFTAKDLIVTFFPTVETETNIYKVNFKDSKARIHKKHPRNNNPKKIPTFIHFFTSDDLAIKGLKLYKTDA